MQGITGGSHRQVPFRAAAINHSSQALQGILSALLFALIVFGSILLSIVESDLTQAIASGAASPFLGAAFSGFGLTGLNKLQARSTPFLPDANLSMAGLIEAPPEKMPCPTPAGWVMYILQADDTLDSLAGKFGVPSQSLSQSNCLDAGINRLIPGTNLFVPGPTPTLTATRPPKKAERRCGPPAGWVIYTVRSGDTLFSLSRLVGAGIAQIQQANCLGSSTSLRAGQGLYLPHQPPRPTATRTPAPAPTSTDISTATETQPPASISPSSTPVSSLTFTPQPPDPSTASPTPSPTSTPVPIDTATISPQPSDTPQPSSTPQPSDTPKPSSTPQPTETPTIPPPPPPGALSFLLIWIMMRIIIV